MCIGSRPNSVTLFVQAYSAEHALFLAKTFMREIYSSAVVAKPEHLAWAKCNNHRIMVDRKLS